MSLDTLDTQSPPTPLAVAQVGAKAAAPSPRFAPEDIAPLPAEEVDALLDEMTDPLNRYYRYPVAKGMLPLFMRLPFTPNHITAFHACLGLAAGVLIARGTPRALVAAFVFAEARMIFDCLDGVVARAKKLGSPHGRTIDEMGDAVGYVGMQLGTLVHVHQHQPGESLAFMIAAGMLVPGWMAMTYDYYKRTFTSFLRGMNDSPAEELVRKSARRARDGEGGVVIRFALVFEWLQATLLTPFALPELVRRVRRETVVPGSGVTDPQLAAAARGVRLRARTPGFRRLLRFTSIVSGDNAIAFFNFGLLTFALAKVEKAMIAAGFLTFAVVTLTCAAWVKKGVRNDAA